MLQARGAGITASVPDADTVPAVTPRGCQAEYLDQPVTPTPSTSSSTIARSCRSVTLSGRSSVPRAHSRPPVPVAARRAAPNRRRFPARRRRLGQHRTGRTRCRRDRTRMPGTELKGAPRRTGTSACRLHVVAVSRSDANSRQGGAVLPGHRSICECIDSPLCKHYHRLKQHPCWNVKQFEDGWRGRDRRCRGCRWRDGC